MDRTGVENWLDLYGVKNYTINEDLSVDVNGDVDLFSSELIEIPVRFGVVSGNFDCFKNKLQSLKNCPIEVGGDFSCFNNELLNLDGCPIKVGGNFYCGFNELLDDYFKGLPYAQVKLYLDNKSLKSLLISDATVLSNNIKVGKKI